MRVSTASRVRGGIGYLPLPEPVPSRSKGGGGAACDARRPGRNQGNATAESAHTRSESALGSGFGNPARIRSLSAAIAIAGFAADAALERGVASGVLYVAVIALTAWLPGMRATLGAGIAASALALLGYFVSPPGGELWKAVVNRLLGLFAIWVTVALVWHHKRQNARRDLAEARAVRSEAQFRQTVEASPNGMLLVGQDGHIALVNLEAERLFGYPRRELLGQPIECLVPELDRAAHARHRVAFLAESAPRRMGGGREIQGVDKAGRALSLEIGLVRVETRDGQFILATLTDLSDRKKIRKAREARLLARRLLEAEEGQRRRMSREIHDALGQALTALKLDIGWLARHLPEGQADMALRIGAMEDVASRTIEDVRRLSAELRPAVLDDQGLRAAIRWQVGDFEKRTGLRCALALPAEEVDWSDDRCTAAYRVLQESLTNVVRHAAARHVTVALWRQRQGDAVLEIHDDGQGFSTAQAARPGALGLLGMRERALLHGGTLTVTSAPGEGTTVTLSMPGGLDEPLSEPGPNRIGAAP